MKPVFVFTGPPVIRKFFVMRKLFQLLKWLDYQTTPTTPPHEFNVNSVSNYHLANTVELTLPIENYTIIHAFLRTKEQRESAEAKIRSLGGTPIFIEVRSTIPPSIDQKSLTVLANEAAESLNVIKLALTRCTDYHPITDKDDLSHWLAIEFREEGGRNVVSKGIQDVFLQKIAKFLSDVIPVEEKVIFLDSKAANNGKLQSAIRLLKNKVTYIFCSSEVWSLKLMRSIEKVVSSPDTYHLHDNGIYVVSCLDEEVPVLNFAGLTTGEIENKYLQSKPFQNYLKKQDLTTDLMTTDEVDEILIRAHEDTIPAFSRVANTLTKKDYIPLLSTLESKLGYRVVIGEGRSLELLESYFALEQI